MLLNSLTELKRQWEELTDSSVASVAPFDFSVMSYNILSQELLLSNPYLYKHCNPRVLEWRHRFTNLINELERHAADVRDFQPELLLLLCTQLDVIYMEWHLYSTVGGSERAYYSSYNR